jgi:hypothetical protein
MARTKQTARKKSMPEPPVIGTESRIVATAVNPLVLQLPPNQRLTEQQSNFGDNAIDIIFPPRASRVQMDSPETKDEETTKSFSGVVAGKEGFNGIVNNYADAFKHFQNISRAVWRKFDTEKEANDYIQKTRHLKDDHTNEDQLNNTEHQDPCPQTSSQEASAPVMTPEEIQEWTDSYTKELLILYFSNETQDKRAMKQYYATLADLFMASQSAATFTALLNKSYRWEARYAYDIGDGIGQSSQKIMEKMEKEEQDKIQERKQLQQPTVILPHGCRYVLQIKDTSKQPKWQDWVYLAKSDYAFAGIGLFAARNFPKGGVIGFYVGKETWKANQPGTETPTEKYMESLGIDDTKHNLFVRDSSATMHLLSPKPFDANNSQMLHMGMHFMNNATYTFDKGTKKNEKSKTKNNSYIVQDGTILTTGKIYPNQEILSGYKDEEKRPSTKHKLRKRRTCTLKSKKPANDNSNDDDDYYYVDDQNDNDDENNKDNNDNDG